MLPWGHLAFGYLVYTVGTRLRHRRAPAGAPTVVLAFGTQFPDLIDKPLNWWFGVLDGRGIAHSLLTTALVCGLLFAVARRYGRRDLAAAFTVGVLTHLLGDSWGALLSGNYGRASFLLWPLLPAPTYPKDSLVDHLRQWAVYFRSLSDISPAALLGSRFGVQLLLFAVLIGVWAFDGFPGLGTVWRALGRNRSRREPEA